MLPFDVDVDGPVQALALVGDTMYLGGQFASVNGSLAALKRDRRNLAAVDATTGIARDWDPDADNVVSALTVAGDTVFAGGAFGMVNRTTPRQRLAAFDALSGTARAWDPSADAQVRSLAVHGPTVFAGGDFLNVNGGVPRVGIAALDAQTGVSDPLSVELIPEERAGPVPPVARVDALLASPQAGLLMGGSYVMNTPTLRAANFAVFGLPPLPVGAAAAATAAAGDETDPELALERLPAPVRRGSPGDAPRRDRHGYAEEAQEGPARHHPEAAPQRARAGPLRPLEEEQRAQGGQAVRQAHAREPQAQALYPPHPQGDVQAHGPGRALEGRLQRPDRTPGAEARPLRAARDADRCRGEQGQAGLAVDHDRALVAEQHLQPLGAALQVGAMDLRVAARAGLPPRRQILVSLHMSVRTRLLAACCVLVHGVRSPPSESSPFIRSRSGLKSG